MLEHDHERRRVRVEGAGDLRDVLFGQEAHQATEHRREAREALRRPCCRAEDLGTSPPASLVTNTRSTRAIVPDSTTRGDPIRDRAVEPIALEPDDRVLERSQRHAPSEALADPCRSGRWARSTMKVLRSSGSLGASVPPCCTSGMERTDPFLAAGRGPRRATAPAPVVPRCTPGTLAPCPLSSSTRPTGSPGTIRRTGRSSRTSRSRSTRAPRSASSGRTAPASPACSGSWPVWTTGSSGEARLTPGFSVGYL